jgi:hypothetical protein
MSLHQFVPLGRVAPPVRLAFGVSIRFKRMPPCILRVVILVVRRSCIQWGVCSEVIPRADFKALSMELVDQFAKILP